MDYSKLSDHEINVKVGSVIGFAAKLMAVNKQTDYCNNPEDAWPIISENGISLIKCTVDSGYWSAEIITDIDDVTDKIFQCQSSFDYQDANPLRAAMVVFLMMQEK
ncbi:hypothetical protein DOV11_04120 [Salmonella enterica]|nr:DUF2591 domain-containing protein [Salmonella enterica]EAU0855616.1 hypothetical protein [Salmonella enterica]